MSKTDELFQGWSGSGLVFSVPLKGFFEVKKNIVVPRSLELRVYIIGEDSPDGEAYWLNLEIDMQECYIVGWQVPHCSPKANASVKAKVCDTGHYTLYDADRNQIGEHKGYVPLCIQDGGYGDWLNLEIDLRTGGVTLPAISVFPEFGGNIASLNQWGQPGPAYVFDDFGFAVEVEECGEVVP